MQFETQHLTHDGGHDENQDYQGHLELNGGACWVVADGLGGHGGGAVASRVAVEAVLESFRSDPDFSREAVQEHIQAAQTALLERQAQQPDLQQMRTTLTILITNYRSVLWGHVGDSRLYRFQGGRVAFQTKDHSVPQAMANAGDIPPEAIRFHEDRNKLLRALGKDEEVKATIAESPTPLYRHDAFLLCVDGFWEYVTEAEMEIDLAKSQTAAQWLEAMEERLCTRAPAVHDNYTATAVLHVDDQAPEPPRPSRETPDDEPRRRPQIPSILWISTLGVVAGVTLIAGLLYVSWKPNSEEESAQVTEQRPPPGEAPLRDSDTAPGGNKTPHKTKEKEDSAKLTKEKEDAAKLAKEKEDAAKLAKEKEDAAKLAKEKEDAAKLAKEKEDAAKLAKEKEDAAKLAKEKEDTAKLAKEKEDAAKLAKEKEDAAKLAKEKEDAAKLTNSDGQDGGKPQADLCEGLRDSSVALEWRQHTKTDEEINAEKKGKVKFGRTNTRAIEVKAIIVPVPPKEMAGLLEFLFYGPEPGIPSRTSGTPSWIAEPSVSVDPADETTKFGVLYAVEGRESMFARGDWRFEIACEGRLIKGSKAKFEVTKK